MAVTLSISELPEYIKKLHQQNKIIVVTGGCFDLLHIGHINLLENAKKQGDIVMVLLESDETIRKMKGIDRPIHSQKDRAYMLAALRPVDVIVLLKPNMNNKNYDQLIQTIHPTIIATTENDAAVAHKERQAQLVGAKVIAVNKYIPSISTTKLLEILEKEKS